MIHALPSAHYEGSAHKDAIVFDLPLSEPESIRLNGHQFARSSLGAIRENGSIDYSAKKANRFAAVVLPSDLFRNTERFDAKETAVLEASNSVLTVDPRRLALLRRMIERFAASQDPLSESAEHIVEEEFIGRIISALGSCAKYTDARRGWSWVSHQQVLRTVRELIASAGNQVVYMDDLCRTAGVSERTLRVIFNKTFGVGPIRYLRNRRLHLMRAALHAADASCDTVADVATQFGLWEFGRLAREYYALFGELPSQTLLSERGDHDPIRSQQQLSPVLVN